MLTFPWVEIIFDDQCSKAITRHVDYLWPLKCFRYETNLFYSLQVSFTQFSKSFKSISRKWRIFCFTIVETLIYILQLFLFRWIKILNQWHLKKDFIHNVSIPNNRICKQFQIKFISVKRYKCIFKILCFSVIDSNWNKTYCTCEVIINWFTYFCDDFMTFVCNF